MSNIKKTFKNTFGIIFNMCQMNKRSKSMRNIKKTLALSLAVMVVFLISPASQTLAHNNDTVAKLTTSQARGVARQYLNSLGYSRIGTSQSTALVGEAELTGNIWVIKVNYDGRMANKTATLFVNDTTGQIEQNID